MASGTGRQIPPEELSGIIKRLEQTEMHEINWDSLDAQQRRVVAQQFDAQRNPTEEMERDFALVCAHETLVRDIEDKDRLIFERETTPASTHLEIDSRDAALARLRREREVLEHDLEEKKRQLSATVPDGESPEEAAAFPESEVDRGAGSTESRDETAGSVAAEVAGIPTAVGGLCEGAGSEVAVKSMRIGLYDNEVRAILRTVYRRLVKDGEKPRNERVFLKLQDTDFLTDLQILAVMASKIHVVAKGEKKDWHVTFTLIDGKEVPLTYAAFKKRMVGVHKH